MNPVTAESWLAVIADREIPEQGLHCNACYDVELNVLNIWFQLGGISMNLRPEQFTVLQLMRDGKSAPERVQVFLIDDQPKRPARRGELELRLERCGHAYRLFGNHDLSDFWPIPGPK